MADLLGDQSATSATESQAPGADGPKLATVDARRSWRRFQQLMSMPEKDRRAVFRMIDSLSRTKGQEQPAA